MNPDTSTRRDQHSTWQANEALNAFAGTLTAIRAARVQGAISGAETVAGFTDACERVGERLVEAEAFGRVAS